MNNTIIRLMTAVLFILCCFIGFNAAAEEVLVKTPADYEGPFYPVTRQQDIDNDLIHVRGQEGTAKGDLLDLTGVVVNTKGEPQKDVTIEIWQTDPQGRYKHPGDSTPGERDPNFQYWGHTVTNEDGSYMFKTLVPGDYNPRPAHIHFKVWRDGKLILTSQIYFTRDVGRYANPSMSGKTALQTVELEQAGKAEFSANFRIVI